EGAGGGEWIGWDGQPVTAEQFLGLLPGLPGYEAARVLNGGMPPALGLVVCDAAAAGAVSFAALVDRGYGGPVVAALSKLDQPEGGGGNVVARDGGFVYG